jgi:ring-1,2-phenylacetyl-CoA epoxidase subunit PaaC
VSSDEHDNAYAGLIGPDDARWAFGSSFTDPLGGVDTTVPEGVEGSDLAAYCLMLGDDALIMSHRLQEWVTRAPELEDELAIANIALDLLGQARLLLARAGRANPRGRDALRERAGDDVPDEEVYAYFRAAEEFRNVAFVEPPLDDFAELAARLTVFAAWRLGLLERLRGSRDPVLAAIAEKGVKEITYHLDYAGRWVVRLGDGTEISHERMQVAVDLVWPQVGELLERTEIEERLGTAGIAADPSAVDAGIVAVLEQLAVAGGLRTPERDPAGLRGRAGHHTQALTALLEELQELARAHPEATW